MRRVSRRAVLGLLAGGTAAAGLGIGGASMVPTTTGRLLRSDLELPEPFTVPLPVPRPIAPESVSGDADVYRLAQRAVEAEILPGVRTGIWGYNGTFPGPLFDVRAGRTVRVEIANELPVPTSTHLHGGVTPPESDGYPTDVTISRDGGFRPHMRGHNGMELSPEDWTFHDGVRAYDYPLPQRAATLWYHDHRMDFSAPQVWRGLAGMFIVRDDTDDALPLPEGDRDIPLMVCDRAFTAEGELSYPALDPSLREIPGVQDAFMDGVTGDINLVNGAPWPELEVSGTRYRFRLLNAANARRYRFALEPAPQEGPPFVQVGSDQGLLAEPVELAALAMSPGERRDVVVDFSGYPVDTEIRLVNRLAEGAQRNVMRFRVTRRENDDAEVPRRLADVEVLRPDDAVRTRTFDFRRVLVGGSGGNMNWTVNGAAFEPGTPLADPELGTVERWRLASDFHHPVHIHLAHFQVLSRNGRDPGPQDAGWKDTVDVRPYEVVEVLARFDGFRGRYMLHCHNLEHEDMAMMADFDVV
ncbi:multicopper oxidase family protein [Nocardiopsis sediminis]|uniref:Multicopper oxidase CueO n=1 Tax=Nocardiopsis sediminis TaxID=1778267 RepID=A0ABV8FWX7_9ACTN